MAFGIWVWSSLAGNFPHWVFTLGGILIAIVVYSTGLAILKTEELRQLTEAIRKRFSRS